MATAKIIDPGTKVVYASGTTPSDTNEAKVVSDSSYYGKYVPVSIAIWTGNVWYFNPGVVSYVCIKSDGIYVKLSTAAWGSSPCMIILAKTS